MDGRAGEVKCSSPPHSWQMLRFRRKGSYVRRRQDGGVETFEDFTWFKATVYQKKIIIIIKKGEGKLQYKFKLFFLKVGRI